MLYLSDLYILEAYTPLNYSVLRWMHLQCCVYATFGNLKCVAKCMRPDPKTSTCTILCHKWMPIVLWPRCIPHCILGSIPIYPYGQKYILEVRAFFISGLNIEVRCIMYLALGLWERMNHGFTWFTNCRQNCLSAFTLQMWIRNS